MNLCGWLLLTILLLFSVDMDVLVSIPRTFIPGYSFTISGLLLCIKCKSRWLQIVGGFCAMLGIVMSETAICIFLPILVYIVWRHVDMKKYLWALIGIYFGLVVRNLFMQFYEINPEYLVWSKANLSFNLELFLGRIHEFTTYFANLIIFQNAWVFLAIVLVLFFLLVLTGNSGASLIILTTIGGLFLTLGFTKIGRHDTVLWSATRMLLFVPYNLALVVYLSDFKDIVKLNREKEKLVKVKRLMPLFVMAICFMSSFIKYVDYKNRESEFKSSSLNGVMEVEGFVNKVEQEYKVIKENNCDFAIVPYSTDSLALEALYYGEISIVSSFFRKFNFAVW